MFHSFLLFRLISDLHVYIPKRSQQLYHNLNPGQPILTILVTGANRYATRPPKLSQRQSTAATFQTVRFNFFVKSVDIRSYLLGIGTEIHSVLGRIVISGQEIHQVFHVGHGVEGFRIIVVFTYTSHAHLGAH